MALERRGSASLAQVSALSFNLDIPAWFGFVIFTASLTLSLMAPQAPPQFLGSHPQLFRRSCKRR